MKTIKLNLFPTPQKFHSNFVSQRSQENRKYIHTVIFTGHGHSKSQIEVHLLCESKHSGRSTGCKALNRAMGCFTTTGIHLAKHLKSIGMSLTISQFPKTHINIINSPHISMNTHATSDFCAVFCEFYCQNRIKARSYYDIILHSLLPSLFQ